MLSSMALIKHIDWSDLNDLYLEKRLSLGEIAIKKGCTKQNLQKKPTSRAR